MAYCCRLWFEFYIITKNNRSNALFHFSFWLNNYTFSFHLYHIFELMHARGEVPTNKQYSPPFSAQHCENKMQRKHSAVFFSFFFTWACCTFFMQHIFLGECEQANVHAAHHLLNIFGHFILKNLSEVKILTKYTFHSWHHIQNMINRWKLIFLYVKILLPAWFKNIMQMIFTKYVSPIQYDSVNLHYKTLLSRKDKFFKA